MPCIYSQHAFVQSGTDPTWVSFGFARKTSALSARHGWQTFEPDHNSTCFQDTTSEETSPIRHGLSGLSFFFFFRRLMRAPIQHQHLLATKQSLFTHGSFCYALHRGGQDHGLASLPQCQAFGCIRTTLSSHWIETSTLDQSCFRGGGDKCHLGKSVAERGDETMNRMANPLSNLSCGIFFLFLRNIRKEKRIDFSDETSTDRYERPGS
ncbi:hypothetical protein CCHR01_18154 [Colletotrichum chrysophilum]|uniref:Uncharacterized protein n=1 Tax=Colletotrichum chrysophilum TaxID=1836956 RepID=A0AAD9E969_9PEZI|nr:hypothetical protein CCHR01_18154 [Colletotrichum chrysophilum]